MKKGRLFLTAVAVLVAAGLLASKSWAQPAQTEKPMRHGQGPKEGGPCKADIEKFCKDVKPGGGAIRKCLKEHGTELSEACTAVRAKAKEKMGEIKEKMGKAHDACKADIENFCKDVKPGGGAIMKCLKEHDTELSEACKTIRAKAKEKMGEMKEKRKERMRGMKESMGMPSMKDGAPEPGESQE